MRAHLVELGRRRAHAILRNQAAKRVVRGQRQAVVVVRDVVAERGVQSPRLADPCSHAVGRLGGRGLGGPQVPRVLACERDVARVHDSAGQERAGELRVGQV